MWAHVRRILLGGMIFAGAWAQPGAISYVVIDTGQEDCFDDATEMTCPEPGEPFYGQDSQHDGNLPQYALSSDGLTVIDHHTGLIWQQAPDTNGDGSIDSDDKLTWIQFQDHPATLNAANFGGYADWRVPTIKELYSLIDFRGIDPSGFSGPSSDLVPFIDTDYFAFAYGDESIGERLIDAQYWSGTEYVGTVFGGEPAVFGVNFADGRIKGYPRDMGPTGPMTQFARFVRGHAAYGINALTHHGDGTITDGATGLMWMQADNGDGLDWQAALDYAENLTFAGHDDWRLPNAKELQSIVDYTRSPTTTGSAAIDPLFQCTSILDEAGNWNYPYYWTSTTHINWTPTPGSAAVYVAFGQALGYFGPPGMEQWCDVHGAGAQRSDPKSGDPSQWPYGHGPQGDAIRIFNYVRCVRDVEYGNSQEGGESSLGLRIAPNPSLGATTFSMGSTMNESLSLNILNASGRLVRAIAGRGPLSWDGRDEGGRSLPAGRYHVRVRSRVTAVEGSILLLR